MKVRGLGLRSRLRYFAWRTREFDSTSLVSRARAVAGAHDKSPMVIMLDMLWSAAFRSTAFQDYVDFDFAMLTREERATFMTHSLSNHIAMKFDAPDYRSLFHDKLNFNQVFDALLGREWLDVRSASVMELEAFVTRHGRVMAKVPFSTSGLGVERYDATTVRDWTGFRNELILKGQTLVEEYITQHPVLAAFCAGTTNSTRITTFFDGRQTHILSMAQKFGRGAASDQQAFGGFYTMLDLSGASQGPGYDSHDHVYPTHPDSGVSVVDFQLPMTSELFDFIDRACRVVPQVQYVGWDVVIGERGPILIEGNWAAGVYENKPSVTGVRRGSRPRFKELIGF